MTTPAGILESTMRIVADASLHCQLLYRRATDPATVGITRTRFRLAAEGSVIRPELPDADLGAPAYMSRIGCTQRLNPL